jgi:hypothetical protein
MYTIWHTGHQINETVTEAFYHGALKLSSTDEGYSYKHTGFWNGKATPSISYGILRGTGDIFNKCRLLVPRTEWWEIDRGYFKPNHFEGYYRISLNGIRATYCKSASYENEIIAPDVPSDRLDKLDITLKPWRGGKNILLCPPTDYIAEWEGIDVDEWVSSQVNKIKEATDRPIKIRKKADPLPLEHDLVDAHFVIGYQSNVVLDALRAGIPAFNTDCYDVPLNLSHIEGEYKFDRERLFRFLSYCQFTLDEFRSGYAWKTALNVQKYGTV